MFKSFIILPTTLVGLVIKCEGDPSSKITLFSMYTTLSTPKADSILLDIFIIVQSGMYLLSKSTIDKLPTKAVVSLIIIILQRLSKILITANFLVSS